MSETHQGLAEVAARIPDRFEPSVEELMDLVWVSCYLDLKHHPRPGSAEAKLSGDRGEGAPPGNDEGKEAGEAGLPPKNELGPSKDGRHPDMEWGYGLGEPDSLGEWPREEAGEGRFEVPSVYVMELGAVIRRAGGIGELEKQRGFGVTKVHLPGAVPFETMREQLVAALRPLRSSRITVEGPLDEEMTIENSLAARILRPAWRKEVKPACLLTVVMEGSRSSGFWTAWMQEWVNILRQASRQKVEVFLLREQDGGFVLARFLIRRGRVCADQSSRGPLVRD
jgi:hypothetical protein